MLSGLLLANLFRPAGSHAGPSPALISVAELKTLQDASTTTLILDVRSTMHYLLAHVPGARNIWRPEYEADEKEYPYAGMRASQIKMERLLSELGATHQTRIVLYDEREGMDAARFWWLLKLYGHDRVSLLDGGLAAWKKQGNPIRRGMEKQPESTLYRFQGTAHPAYLADMETIRKRSVNTVILDVRSYEEFTGKKRKSGAYRKGRIPGSLWLEYKQSLGAEGFLDQQSLGRLFAEHNITPEQTIIVYCQSGVRSAHTHFVLTQLLDYPKVKNYDGSWVEWSWHGDLPIESGPVLQGVYLK